METTANELAKSAGLSRKTCSVTRDSKRDQLIIVEEVSETGTEFPRRDVFYFIHKDVDTDQINALLQNAKNQATLAFLGLETTKGIVGNAPVETTDGVKPTIASAKEKKAASVAAAKAKKLAAAEAKKAAAAKEDDLLGEDDPLADDAPEVEVVLYDKANREHAGFLRPVVIATLGADWKKDDKAMVKVRAAIGKLNGKVAVSDVEGKVLESFEVTCKKLLAA